MYNSVLLAAISDVPDVRLRVGAQTSEEQLRCVRCAMRGRWVQKGLMRKQTLKLRPLRVRKIGANF